MALLPEIHVDLNQVTFERVYQLFLPLMPGGALVGGLVFAHPDKASAVVLTLGLGQYSRFVFFFFCVYAVGLMLYGFSMVITGNCSMLLSHVVGKVVSPKRPNEVSAKSTIWRRVATEFLGTLTPVSPPLPAHPISGNDVEWQDFYNVLQDYVLRGAPVLANELLLLFTYLQATSWALLFLYWNSPLHGHWSVLMVSVTLIVFGALLPFSANFVYWKYDRLTPWDFIARLINEIKMRQK